MTMLQHGMVGSDAAYQVGNSLRFRGVASGYLSRTPSTAGDRKKLAMRFRVKRGELGSVQVIASAGTTSVDSFYFDASNRLCLNVLGTVRLITTPVFRDPTAWYVDVGFELDVSNGTATSRAKILIDGVEVSAYSTDTRSSITNTDTNWNNTVVHYIGRSTSGNYFDGYICEPVLVDGTTSISYSHAGPNGVRDPIQPFASYGTNGFYLPFSDGTSLSTLTADASGNGNNWTASNISLTAGTGYDWMEDTPTNNFAVLNPLDVTNTVGTLTSGNLTLQQTVTGNVWGRASIPVTAGKYYVEYTLTTAPPTSGTSVQLTTTTVGAAFSYNAYDGSITYNGSSVGTYATSGSGTVLALAIDRDANTLDFYRNNVLIYSGTSLASGAAIFRAFLGATGGIAINFGQRPFAYTPPTGFLTLCTANLTDTTITTSGSFTGNASANGPFVYLNGVPTAMTINGNAVTFATHADKTAGGFKLRTSSASYNTAGTNTYSITTTGAAFKYARAQANP